MYWADFKKNREEFTTPEDINDSPDLAPSKRILKISWFLSPLCVLRLTLFA